MKFNTLNNTSCRDIIFSAINGRYRQCAYLLYNRKDDFTPELFQRLLSYTFLHLGVDNFFKMLTDKSIDITVRDFFIRLDIDLTINLKGGVKNETKKKKSKA